jgi:DNA-binding MltR family transcriptional regulator
LLLIKRWLVEEGPSWFESHAVFLNALQTEVKDDSLLTLIMICAAHFDNQLLAILRSYLINEKEVIEGLFGGANSALSNFSSRIHMSYGLGLIDKREYKYLNAIRKIRNEFAHRLSVNISSKKVKPHIDTLALATAQYEDHEANPYDRVYMAARILSADLLYRANQVAKERRATKVWPHRED